MQSTTAVNQQAKTLTEENPMRRIITMLQDMQKELDQTIADSEAAIEEWTSKTESGKAESAQLTQEVADHKTSAASATSDLGEATTLREKENKAFVAEEKDTKTNLASLSKAIPAIEKGMSGASLMQMTGAKRMDRLRRYVEV